MKGIILAGGEGTRLRPATTSVVKQLLPIYDKPMIYYPMTTLIDMGIREVLLITQSWNKALFFNLFENGAKLGMKIGYAEQDEPKGIADAVSIASVHNFIQPGDVIVLILGDNLFAGIDFDTILTGLCSRNFCACVFLSQVCDPHRYGIAEFDDRTGDIINIVEKPVVPPSDWAVTGLYAYDHTCVYRVRRQKKSSRGELEITDLNNSYIRDDRMHHFSLERGSVWLDTGTPAALLEASQYVQTIQNRHGVMLGCVEEAAYRQGWITLRQMKSLAAYSNAYGNYLREIG